MTSRCARGVKKRLTEAEAVALLAEDFAAGMDEATVEKCKAAALDRARRG